MRLSSVAALTLLFVAACSEQAPAAPTQTAERGAPSTDWVEPGGRYGADFQRFGWQRRADARPTNIVEMVPAEPWPNETYCAVWEGQRLPARITQAEVNAAMDRHTRETAVSATVESNDLAFWHGAVDGISTVEMRFHDVRFYQRWRMFRLSTPDGVVLINFVCGARLPTTTEQERELDAIVDSLRFFPEQP